ASYGLGSMTNSRSPGLTIAPSRKWMESRYPSTRARTSTRSVASKRPVYSSHSVRRIANGGETTTAGGAGGGGACVERHPLSAAQATPTHSSTKRCSIAKLLDAHDTRCGTADPSGESVARYLGPTDPMRRACFHTPHSNRLEATWLQATVISSI